MNNIYITYEKTFIMATAPYSFYTKESIDRLVELWCNNTISILNNKLQNVVGE